MKYNQFCVNWDLDVSEITSRDYVDMKIRSFYCSTISNRDITKIDNEAFFKHSLDITGQAKKICVVKFYEKKCTYLSLSAINKRMEKRITIR